MSTISFFSSIDAVTTQSYPLDLYLSHVQDGAWRPMVEGVHLSPEKDEKISLPVVALSGLFTIHKDGISLNRHSGFIGIDVEGFRDLYRGKQMLAEDRYTYAVFDNYSGNSLTVLVRIGASKPGQGYEHGLAYQALSEYYEAVYGLITDPRDQLVTKLRFVTYDPDLRANPQAEVFHV
ncbi:BT4734/BF3469 family protein [Cytophagaceae bacterium YF14B1]|uniref:BT4734/BF3469 family protein n=1 Tax=Xanthocytophaga flava TaxID=3048013 RepID=A0AAE3U7J1_9BACT|nr:BT4734/BF3469 family protein [Xanthocytophaga flavus]MDJ1482476.1 BT4734/BF3469 family protein [Xanthocytophaga flavus]